MDRSKIVERVQAGEMELKPVNCPRCRNVNRETRRKCGYCNRQGYVYQPVPVKDPSPPGEGTQ